MNDIAAFLTAQYDEDQRVAEAAAEKAAGSPVYGAPDLKGKWRATNDGIYADTAYGNGPFAIDGYGFLPDQIGAHIARHDPARAIADVAAKRRRLQRHAPETSGYYDRHGQIATFTACLLCGNGGGIDDAWPCDEIRDAAAPYADQPGYLESWRP